MQQFFKGNNRNPTLTIRKVSKVLFGRGQEVRKREDGMFTGSHVRHVRSFKVKAMCLKGEAMS